MLIAVIPMIDIEQTKAHIATVLSKVDGIELRLDYVSVINIKEIAEIRKLIFLPVIFTLRKVTQGGHYQQNEQQRLQNLLNLCSLHPEYIDIEYDVDRDFARDLKQKYPQIKIICSYHDFHKTPHNLAEILNHMRADCYDYYKLVTMANSTLDALNMLYFVQQQKIQQPELQLSAMCMGKAGECTRILAPIIGSAMCYAIFNEKNQTAFGQIPIDDLLSIYCFKKLNKDTKIYALLGEPVAHSIGHLVHNRTFSLINVNAIYIKLAVNEKELPKCLPLFLLLPFMGFSVTMPLKEIMFSRLNVADRATQKIQACNTVLIKNKKFVGYNSDGKAAIQILGHLQPLNQQTILILGAGGTARAIAYEAVQRGAQVTIVNRTYTKAQQLAKEFHCFSAEPKDLPQLLTENNTTVINTLPAMAYQEKTMQDLLMRCSFEHQYVMDVVYQPEATLFLNYARKTAKKIVDGYAMYMQQALLQIHYWFQIRNKSN